MGRYSFLFAGHGERCCSLKFLVFFAAVCWNWLQKFLLSSSKIMGHGPSAQTARSCKAIFNAGDEHVGEEAWTVNNLSLHSAEDFRPQDFNAAVPPEATVLLCCLAIEMLP